MIRKALDANVTGQWGLYSIRATSKRGRAWCKRHLSSGERTVIAGSVMCKGGESFRAIVAGMVKDGLHVEVNGVDMKGFRAL